MDTKKIQKATEIMSELKKLHESLENLKIANKYRRAQLEDEFEKL